MPLSTRVLFVFFAPFLTVSSGRVPSIGAIKCFDENSRNVTCPEGDSCLLQFQKNEAKSLGCYSTWESSGFTFPDNSYSCNFTSFCNDPLKLIQNQEARPEGSAIDFQLFLNGLRIRASVEIPELKVILSNQTPMWTSKYYPVPKCTSTTTTSGTMATMATTEEALESAAESPLSFFAIGAVLIITSVLIW
ncbi:hypothetical protein QR680_014847 [Steinernema hermaphroditum]|uniref:Phlebovirus glycoprotein G2 fusion domain-containing protein n=1 Tax=Steinernema hermaphroditum TaxID=289476 RepID=A0AA39IAC5_9BILA|nr:hypothetical protein QR680_014847 [Steinernema hermaphroditum]